MTRDQEFYSALTALHQKAYVPGENPRLTEKDRAPLKNRMARENKIVESLEKAVELSGLRDGMTISFHHHFRDGDHIVNLVMDTLARMGFRDLRLAPSSLSDVHAPLIQHIKNGVISHIETSGCRGELAKAVSRGLMDEPMIFRSHGGRAAAIEGALGVVNAYAIATASPRLVAIALGAEDYCANLKTSRSLEGSELLYARGAIIVAARAAGIDAIDTVFSDVNNEDQLIRETQAIKQLGFDGKSVINPRQIKPVHRVFTPTQQEITKANRILAASREAAERGSGVVALDGKMIDRPVVLRAERTLELAYASRTVFEEDEV